MTDSIRNQLQTALGDAETLLQAYLTIEDAAEARKNVVAALTAVQTAAQVAQQIPPASNGTDINGGVVDTVTNPAVTGAAAVPPEPVDSPPSIPMPPPGDDKAK